MKLIEWLSCKDELLSFGFTEKEIEKALKDIEFTENDLTEIKGFQNEPKYMGKYELVKSGVYFNIKEYQPIDWERYRKVYGSEYRIVKQYQGLRHGEIIHQLFKNKYKWFDTFRENKIEKSKPNIDNWTKLRDIPKDFYSMTVKELVEMTEPIEITVSKSLWSIYELRNNEAEMYLTTEFGTLYVPYKAITDKNWNLIENRMITYRLSYHDPIKLSGYALNHRGRSEEQYKKDKEQDYLNSIKPLESKEAVLLKSHLN